MRQHRATAEFPTIEAMFETPDVAKLSQRALARWDDKGGAGPDGQQRQETSSAINDDRPAPANAELERLLICSIAPENLMITLLTGAAVGQRAIARAMAASIAPGSGSTQHPFTIHATPQMIERLDRAEHFGTTEATCDQVIPVSG